MKKSIILTLTFILTSICSFGQTTPQVIVPNFNDKFCDYVKKLEAGQTEIDYQDFRFSFIESEQFKIRKKTSHLYDSLKKFVRQEIANNSDHYSQIIKATKEMLCIDYTSMFAHKILQQTYKIIGDTLNSKKYHDIEFGLLKSILGSGDAKTCETGRKVIQIEEEYFILEMIGAELIKQSIDNEGGFCDKMKVKTGKGKKTYYFEVSKVFEGYKK